MKKLFFFTIAIAISLVACDKKSDLDNQPPMQKAPAVDLSSLNNGERVFTDEQIEQIGKIHNEICIEFVKNFNYNAEDVYAAFIEQISQYDICPMEIAQLPLGISSEKYYSDVLQANISEQAHKFVYDVADVCVELGSVNEVEEYIEAQKRFAKEYFKGIELDGVLVALTVFKYSSQLWFDTTEGGMGLGFIFAENFEKGEMANSPMKMSKKDKLKRCLIADGEGAFLAGIFAAILVAFTAPITVGLLVGIGAGAAIASIHELNKINAGYYGIIAFDDKPDVVIKWKDYIMIDDKLVTRPILVNPYFSIK